MNYAKLREIKKLYFGYEEISRLLGICPDSARVSANRYIKQGILVRVKRNLYVLKERWDGATREERFILANLAQVPSYISLMTALDYYEITTQMQSDFIESVGLKRTREIKAENAVFKYSKVDKKLYFGFLRENGFFIALPEKAFLDALYLSSLKRYRLDMASMDFSKLDMPRIKKMIKRFPEKMQKAFKKHEYFKKA
jgi:hypothetical protein